MKPLIETPTEWRTSQRTFVYTFLNHRDGIQVYYADGAYKLFSTRAEAELWIKEIHYPAQLEKIKEELF